MRSFFMDVVFTTWFLQKHILLTNNILCVQHAKKVVSDSPGLVDFAIRLVNSAFYLLAWWASDVFWGIRITRTVKSILLVKKLLGLVDMTSVLVNASFSLPEWQDVKMIFFAPWCAYKISWKPFQYKYQIFTGASISSTKTTVHLLRTSLKSKTQKKLIT